MEAKILLSTLMEQSNEKPVIVQFFADWCGPCKVLKPVLRELEKKNDRKWQLVLINVEENTEIANHYNIRSIPTVYMISKGKEIASFTGSKAAYVIQNWLDNHLPEKDDTHEEDELQGFLQQGNIKEVSSQLLSYLAKSSPDSVIVKLLLALQHLGKDNPEAKQQLNKVKKEGKWGKLAKQIRDLIDIDIDEKDPHTPTHSPYNPTGLDANNRIDVNNFDLGFLNILVHDLINEVRSKEGVSLLENDRILEAAARDHNQYMIKNDVLSHFQDNTMKKSAMDRVISFGGDFRSVGENVQYQGMQIRRYNNKREIITDSYINTAKKIVDNWVNSPGHYKNLINPLFTYVGTSTGWNPETFSIFATQVFGTKY